jgi:thiamine-phosphate pyrophosphorylase
MISGLHYISGEGNGKSHLDNLEEACKAGVRWVQLRVKNKPFREWLELAYYARKICDLYNATLIINDNPEIAKLSGAEGVHLGKTDMNPLKVRETLGRDFIIGGSANTFQDLVILNKEQVDYIGLGPFRFTTSKSQLSPILGIGGLKMIMDQYLKEGLQIPVLAIGGIVPDDVEAILSTGIYGVAVSSCINLAEDKKRIINLFKMKGLLSPF